MKDTFYTLWPMSLFVPPSPGAFQADHDMGTDESGVGTVHNAATGANQTPPRTAGVGQTVPVPHLDAASICDLQQALRQYGYYDGPIDGTWGSLTSAAFNHYQAANGVPEALNFAALCGLGLAAGGKPSRNSPRADSRRRVKALGAIRGSRKRQADQDALPPPARKVH